MTILYCDCNEPGIFHERWAPICRHVNEAQTEREREEVKAKIIAGLTPRARKLWDRVSSSVNFYLWEATDTPKAMVELERAGLVTTMGRVVVMKACYVPVGTKGFKLEQFPGEER